MRVDDTLAGLAAMLLSALMAVQLLPPVQAPHTIVGAPMAQCPDGGLHLAMGCESIHL